MNHHNTGSPTTPHSHFRGPTLPSAECCGSAPCCSRLVGKRGKNLLAVACLTEVTCRSLSGANSVDGACGEITTTDVTVGGRGRKCFLEQPEKGFLGDLALGAL